MNKRQLRERPVYDMVKGIVDMVAEKLHEQGQLMLGSPQILTPFADKTYNAELQWARE